MARRRSPQCTQHEDHFVKKSSTLFGPGCLITSVALIVSKSGKLLKQLLTRYSYNAAVFKIIAVSDYKVTLVDQNSTLLNGTNGLRDHWKDSVRLDNSEWTTIYKQPEVSRYGDLYLVIDQFSYPVRPNIQQVNFTLSNYLPMQIDTTTFASRDWPSGEGWAKLQSGSANQTLPESLHIVEGWTTDNGHNSRIQISLYFMAVVLAFNLFKLAAMIGVLMMDTSEYIVTLGDAAASYLEYPEDLTKGKSVLELNKLFLSFDSRYGMEYNNLTWQPRWRRYCSSIGYDKTWSAIIA